jgi:putative flippase GtrA
VLYKKRIIVKSNIVNGPRSAPDRRLGKTRHFLRYLFVGGINTLFGYSAFALLLYLGLHYALASFIATCSGILFNFNTTGRIVFKQSDHSLLFKFLLVYAQLYFINLLLLKLMKIYAINLYLGSAATILPMAFLAYLLNKRFVFTK